MSELKKGFTTGSAATAAAKASLLMLITGDVISDVKIMTPAGIQYNPKLHDQYVKSETTEASCSIIKESGDDPDITAGIKIFAKVKLTKEPGIVITGGEGVGKVTRPGLDQPVGEWAINSTPRKMISQELSHILDSFEIEKGVCVEISAPEGVDIAKKTFNPHMGIEGGISIIGTSGIVEPMSTRALLDTIKLDISMQKAEGKDKCIIVPGNYGVTFLKNNYNILEDDIVTCSNYVGDAVEMAVKAGFKKILFCSHIGKLIKVSGGIMNTHSMYGDHRMELMCEAYTDMCKEKDISIDEKIISDIMECVSTTAALDILNEKGYVEDVSKIIVKKSLFYLKKASGEAVDLDCVLYENNYGELARSF